MDQDSNIVYESELTESQVQEIHNLGKDWIQDYDPLSRAKWLRALYLWAWDQDVVTQCPNREGIPS